MPWRQMTQVAGYFIGSVNYPHGYFLFRLPSPVRQFVNHPVLSDACLNGPGCGALFYKSGLLFSIKILSSAV
jgi:hypothetical protein